MKLRLVSIAVLTASLVGCASQQVQAPAPHPYAMPAQPVKVAPVAPEWYTRIPENTADMMFAVGTASSVDEQMAYDKARLQAERKLVEQMTSRIRTQTKSYRADLGENMVERTEVTINKTADGELLGAQRVDSQRTFDGRYYKVYILLRYPLGDANVMRKERDLAKSQREAELNAVRAHTELDKETERQRTAQEVADQKRRVEVLGDRIPVPAGR